MKETTYGWYPPARDLLSDYNTKQPLDSYIKECMFKHSQSRYADKPGVQTPEDPINSKSWQASPQQVEKYKSLCRSPSPPRQSRNQSRNSMINLEIRGVAKNSPTNEERRQTATPAVSKSAQRTSSETKMFSPVGYYKQKPRPIKGTTVHSAKAWATKTTETEIPNLQEYLRDCSRQKLTPQVQSTRQSPAPSPARSYLRKSTPTLPLKRDGEMAISVVASSSERRDRIKSATTYRPRTDAPRRSIVSAGPSRPSDDEREQAKEYQKTAEQLIEEFERAKAEEDDGDGRESVRSEESTLLPAETSVVIEPGKQELGVELPLDYEEQLNKYGWRMQVHGDPLNLKKPCIAKRLAFTTKIPEPYIPPNPPKARKENWDTFFLNTIPRKPMTYTIHQEWASEMLHAKRMELQKRDGDTYKYRHTDYAFIY